MIIEDKIYGNFGITETILLDLIQSKTVQRLHGVSQFGLPDEFYHLSGYSRFQHSLGVLLLLKKLNAGIEEQIAGLLHDVSHTAFSHVIDIIWGNAALENFQDSKHLEILLKSDVKPILEKYQFDVHKIADCEQFGLLEQPAPNLCADRIDYTLQELSLREDSMLANGLASNLLAYNNKIIFNNMESAKIFANIYLKYNRESWASFEAVSRYYQLSNILKKSLEKNIIDKDDLWQNDKFVLDKIYKSNDADLIEKLELLKNKITTLRFNITINKKFRHVDPEVLVNNKLERLSNIYHNYRNALASEIKNNSNGTNI